VAQLVGCLPSERETPSSNPSIVRVNSEDSHVKTKPLSSLAGGLLETPRQISENDKGTVNFYLWVGAIDG
jgi:hypothetical protein